LNLGVCSLFDAVLNATTAPFRLELGPGGFLLDAQKDLRLTLTALADLVV
jgi:hypothetical protein